MARGKNRVNSLLLQLLYPAILSAMNLSANLHTETARRILRFIVAHKRGTEDNPTALGNVKFWLEQKSNPESALCYDIPASGWDVSAVQEDINKIAGAIWQDLKTYADSFDPAKFPVYILNGRQTTAWLKGKRKGFKELPLLAATFDTKAEADAFKLGVSLAIGGGLSNVAFISHEDAAAVSSEVWAYYAEMNKANTPLTSF